LESVKVTFLGQSGFLLQAESSSLLVDPRNDKAGDFSGDLVYVTHAHADHTGGVNTFLERNPEAILACNEQVAKKFKKWNERIVLAEPRGEIKQGPWKLRFFTFRHGIFRGVQNTGVIVQVDDFSFGHLGDAVEFQEFYQERIIVLAVPIGSMFAASPKRAMEELKKFSETPQIIIPMHWLWRNPKKFCQQLNESYDCRCIVPRDGKIIDWHVDADQQ
jgi:L-ascorbate metabolism protein UlaG (beta-lactamase superfamily)